MLEVQALACERGDRLLFSHLHMTVKPGEIWQIEGGNGSGKTSLLRILTGLLYPSNGTLLWQHTPLAGGYWQTYWQQMSYVGHFNGLKSHLTPLENLEALSGLRCSVNQTLLLKAIDQAGLIHEQDSWTGQLSAGQKRRLSLARLCVEKTVIWILDEPFTALDALAVEWVTRLLVAHAQQGGMVILTTHQPVFFSYPIHRLVLSDFSKLILNDMQPLHGEGV